MSRSGVRYRGRLAPTPSGYLHRGHAATFLTAAERARKEAGVLILRNDDLDRARCKPEFAKAMYEDLHFLGLEWEEGPDCGGPFAPYNQSERRTLYRNVFEEFREKRLIYPSPHSRKDVREALRAPQEGRSSEEMVFPVSLRPEENWRQPARPERMNWRLQVPDGEKISFRDGRLGEVSFVAGVDFGDFLVWRKDGYPSYELATVIDDSSMQITEVVRGEDLLTSTARQILLYRALDLVIPDFFHTPLVRDETGRRLAKRDRDSRVSETGGLE